MIGSKNINKLPTPRLEFNWRKVDVNSDWYKRVCDYFLVLPIDGMDIRSNTPNECGVYDEWKVYIGETNISGGSGKAPILDGEVETPFRDFTHMKIDSKSLGGLPRYAVCGEVVTEITQE